MAAMSGTLAGLVFLVVLSASAASGAPGGGLANIDPNLLQQCTDYFGSDTATKAQESCNEATMESCPEPCKEWLQGIPPGCMEVLSVIWSTGDPEQDKAIQAGLDMLNQICETDFQTGTSPSPLSSPTNSPTPPDSSPPPLDPNQLQACVEYFSSQGAMEASQSCASIAASPNVCPEPCKQFLQGIPPACVDLIGQFISASDQEGLDALNNACGTDFHWGQPSSPVPSSPVPTSPSDISPSPVPTSPPIVESPPPSSPLPPEFSSNFTCEGDGYSWVALDADAAEQWDENPWAPDAGPQNAVIANCSVLYEGDIPTSCCAQTGVDSFPWWQYEFLTQMQVKGVRLTPPSDETCCIDAACEETEPCYMRLVNSQIMVGPLSLPDFYDSKEYADILKAVGGNATLAQPAVFAKLNEDSLLCNQVTTVDLLNPEDESLLGAANIGCGMGLIGSSAGVVDPKGRYVTVTLIASPPRSLALCGIEICAKPVGPTA